MFRDDSLIFSLVFFSTDEGLPTTLRVRVMGAFQENKEKKENVNECKWTLKNSKCEKEEDRV